jgi:hypothetical protein
MDVAIIYALVDAECSDPVARVRYVGQTRLHPEMRLYRHWLTADAGAREHRAVWMRAMKRHGREVVWQPLDLVPYYEADSAEQYHIRRLRAMGCDLTNRTDGGRGKRGWVPSDATIAKMRAAGKGRLITLETRAKMSASIRSSAKHRQHLKRLHQLNRRPCPPETRARISAALAGDGNGHTVLTWEKVAAIRARYSEGERIVDLARAFGCSNPTIHQVVHYRSWITR